MSSDMFATLNPSSESRSRRSVTFVCGLFAQALLIGAAVLVGMLFPAELHIGVKQYVLTWLPPLRPPAEPVMQPPPKLVRAFVPKLKLPETPKLTAPSLAEVAVPKVRPTISFNPNVPQPTLPPPPVAQPSAPPKVEIAVKTGLFGGALEPVTTKRPAKEVQTGGFGSPQGLPGRAQGGNPGNVLKLGSFGLPDGPGVGNGNGGRRGIQGVVASAGFGSGVAGPGYTGERTAQPKVTTGSFEQVAEVKQFPLKSQAAPPPADFQPVELLSKPSPVYTDEARRLGIHGEVTLSVVFLASGAIRILGVAQSLGHGLDQAAEHAAAQIRFKPAQRDGKPTDFPATLRIQFRLADQST